MAPDQTDEELVERFAPLNSAQVNQLTEAFVQDDLAISEELDADIWFSVSDSDEKTPALLPMEVRVAKVLSGGHGDRLLALSEHIFAQGNCRSVLMVAGYCPTIDIAYVRTALDALVGCDAVIGPSLDGGYVLVGLTKSIPRLFLDIDMGTPDVLRQTLFRARDLDLHMNVLSVKRGSNSLDDLKKSQAGGELRHAFHTSRVLRKF
jgi:glycosyltransferase A (GT-A) superfamily protein (DUF2064 family)